MTGEVVFPLRMLEAISKPILYGTSLYLQMIPDKKLRFWDSRLGGTDKQSLSVPPRNRLTEYEISLLMILDLN
ncbi:MAG: hypothetical protein EDM77_06680 [Candidatus Jettenia sp. AMX1]|nr:MAG: hypothetical protein EDM77_06680 [Candidatus Jettenia sp. AMX1]MCE7880425.1 hypothetical protein [Candidatus Jettenia sp. AMX1]MCQ3926233.1 hypothetical protein [Candidatus Jettenia sp.]